LQPTVPEMTIEDDFDEKEVNDGKMTKKAELLLASYLK
jgi:hypothetical protein